jgi:hypothetical protein
VYCFGNNWVYKTSLAAGSACDILGSVLPLLIQILWIWSWDYDTLPYIPHCEDFLAICTQFLVVNKQTCRIICKVFNYKWTKWNLIFHTILPDTQNGFMSATPLLTKFTKWRKCLEHFRGLWTKFKFCKLRGNSRLKLHFWYKKSIYNRSVLEISWWKKSISLACFGPTSILHYINPK